MNAPALKIVRPVDAQLREPAIEPRVVGITFRRRDEHEWLCLHAFRNRQHPAWSQYACGLRIEAVRRGVGA